LRCAARVFVADSEGLRACELKACFSGMEDQFNTETQRRHRGHGEKRWQI
jgi:hypothetical protein